MVTIARRRGPVRGDRGALTWCAALTLFLRALRSRGAGSVLFALYGGALVRAVAGLAAFAAEMWLAGRTVREMVDAEASAPRRH